MLNYSQFLHFILELYNGIRYFIGTNTLETRQISRKIVRIKIYNLKQFSKGEDNSLSKILYYIKTYNIWEKYNVA